MEHSFLPFSRQKGNACLIVTSMGKNNGEVYAAIALAMHEFKGNNVHDKEAGIITIQSRHSDWESHLLRMTNSPK